jgi:5-methylcytosine-specific restriction endonuclease McrA
MLAFAEVGALTSCQRDLAAKATSRCSSVAQRRSTVCSVYASLQGVSWLRARARGVEVHPRSTAKHRRSAARDASSLTTTVRPEDHRDDTVPALRAAAPRRERSRRRLLRGHAAARRADRRRRPRRGGVKPSEYDKNAWERGGRDRAWLIRELRKRVPTGLYGAPWKRPWLNRARARLALDRGSKCAHCGLEWDMWRTLDYDEPCPLVVDHVVPLSQDGDHALDNMQLLCKRCHRAKTIADRPPRLSMTKAERRALLRERGWECVSNYGAGMWSHHERVGRFTLAAAVRRELEGGGEAA